MRSLLIKSVACLCMVLTLPCLIWAQGRLKPPKPREAQAPETYGIHSKKAAHAYEQALIAIGYTGYGEAQDYLKQAIVEEPAFMLAHYRKAEILVKYKQYEAAAVEIQIADSLTRGLTEEVVRQAPHLDFYTGLVYKSEAKYAEAEAAFKRYLGSDAKNPQYASQAANQLAMVDFAANAMAHPIQFEPHNLGPEINTAGQEYVAYLTADDQLIFFTSRQPVPEGMAVAPGQDEQEDFYYSIRKDGHWQKAIPLGPPINTPLNEGTSCISADGQRVFFTKCNNLNDCDIYTAELNGTVWSAPESLGPVVNSRYWESYPCISNDGRTLYYSSARPGGKGGVDIWRSEKGPNGWQTPINLGSNVNSAGDEYGAFLHADDQTLYFSSDGRPGFGGFDLYMTHRTPEGWAEPQNLGYPLNTPANEQSIFINAAGTEGYLNTDAPGGYGGIDLYSFGLDKSIRPNPATFVRGLVYDSLTRKPVGATVTFIDLGSADTVRAIDANTASGRFLTSLPLAHDYAAFVDAPGYVFYSQHFSLKEVKGRPYFDLNIPLQPIRAGAKIVLNNLFFAFDKYDLDTASFVELGRVVRFLQANPRVKIEIGGHTDDAGTEAYNLLLSRKRATAVATYLTQKGIPSARLVAMGYGKTQPLANNGTDAGRALNRRTEFRILGLK